ncbi:MAG: glycosyltransferase [Candidatus Eisenbacteria bacterium]|nr:glycosyltransferase [Candidatus Latescibacterota bacterium]MBD3301927.1 glycosyltransferase [Candidatus Eisenbacteria bacterium]
MRDARGPARRDGPDPELWRQPGLPADPRGPGRDEGPGDRGGPEPGRAAPAGLLSRRLPAPGVEPGDAGVPRAVHPEAAAAVRRARRGDLPRGDGPQRDPRLPEAVREPAARRPADAAPRPAARDGRDPGGDPRPARGAAHLPALPGPGDLPGGRGNRRGRGTGRAAVVVTRAPARFDLSVVIPVYNEEESIPRLVEELRGALEPLDRTFEILLIDDGSSDDSWRAIRDAAAGYAPVRGIRLTRNFGQTGALMAGIDLSEGEIVVTMDGDLQNDPADIPMLVAKIEEGYEIVTGWRKRRQDRWFTRKLPSRVANWMVRKATGVTIRDQGCALKAYRGRVIRNVSLYSDFHRFIVPLTQMGGARIAEVETHHRPRRFGRSKYGLGRTLRVLADLTTLLMITRFSDRLFLWFFLFAVPPLLLGVLATIWMILVALSPYESMLVPIGSAVLMLQTVFAVGAFGLLAEKIRQLAPLRRRRGDRVLAMRIDPRTESPTALLIRNGQATPLVGRSGPTPAPPGR